MIAYTESLANPNLTSSYLHLNASLNSNGLCGFPSFCSLDAITECADTKLSSCERCSMMGAGWFATVAVLLALMIIFGNLLVVASVLCRKKDGSQDGFGKIKCSLAVADMLTGIQIFGVVMYNFTWTINSSANEIARREYELRGSIEATIGTIFFLIGFTSSLYHLLFLGQQRLYAIWRPLKYRSQSQKVVQFGLVAVWICSFVTATMPLWMPSVFTFTYLHTLFMFFVAVSDFKLGSSEYTGAITFPVVTVLAPFFVMTCLTMATAILARKRVQSGQRIRSENQKIANHKREIRLCRTVTIMQLTFTVTLAPMAVVCVLHYFSVLTCDIISLPYLISFFASMSNSLVNVLVYSARDSKFRGFVGQVFTLRQRGAVTISSKNKLATANA